MNSCKVTLMAFLLSEFSDVSSNCLLQQMKSQLGAFVWFFSRVSFQMHPQMDAKSHWLHLYVFIQSEFSDVSSNRLLEQMQSRIDCICVVSPQNEF